MDFWRQFWFFTNKQIVISVQKSNLKNSISDQRFWFLTKKSSLDQKFEFLPKIRVLTNNSNFDQKFEFLPKIRVGPKIRVLTKNSSFVQKFEFCPKIRVWTKNSSFDQKCDSNFFGFIYFLRFRYTLAEKIWLFWVQVICNRCLSCHVYRV